jgi:two-component system chemotaxis response regulator CheV
MQRGQNTEILLESGTNELELLEFEIGTGVYGINIAKVVEITTAQATTIVPDSSEYIDGVFMSRGVIVPVVDLFKVTQNEHKENERAMFIVSTFNQMTVAFYVGNVRQIRRISWDAIKEPPKIVNVTGRTQRSGLLTGVASVDGHMILVLDFEKIVSEINASAGLDTENLESVTTDAVNLDKQIIVVDDSPFLNKAIVDALQKTGFKNIQSFKNGADAWEYLKVQRDIAGNVTDKIACVVSDIEMPQMDGHHLTKCIKEDVMLKRIPVFLFSSLINEQMYAKGLTVGADGQFAKPQIKDLTDAIVKLLK